MILRLVSEFRRAMDLSLVLDEEGIPHRLTSLPRPEDQGEQWALVVDDENAERAAAALLSFERENAPRPKPKEPAPVSDGLVAGLLFGAPLLAFHLWVPREWVPRGSAEAAAIVAGEWWRALTALTLHADYAHVLGNAVLGALFVGFLARRLGTGLALALTLAGGVLGTAATALLVRRDFVSVGASTAVFAALGALAALPGRRVLQLSAAVALLGFLGTGKRADLLGHLCGFAFGLLLGWLARPVRGRIAQALLGALTLAAPCAAWLRALR
jgi:membrane associated rhomboid family serine protease